AWLGRRLLGEPVSARLAAGIGLALVGTAITSGGDVRISMSALGGDLLALAGAATFTGYLLIGRTVRARTGTAGYSVPVYLVVAVCSVFVARATGGAVIPSGRTVLAGLGVAAVCTVLGHTVFNWTLRHLRAVIVSLAFLGEPPITALLAIPFLGEWPPRSAVMGGVAVLLGLGFALTEPAQVPVAEEAAAQ